MKSKLGDKARLNHILDSISEIEIFFNGIDYEGFISNSMLKFATLKLLEIIGEASNHISIDTKILFPQVNWAQIVGLRNVIVHEYFGVDNQLVWEIVQTDLPLLKPKIEEILNLINN